MFRGLLSVIVTTRDLDCRTPQATSLVKNGKILEDFVEESQCIEKNMEY